MKRGQQSIALVLLGIVAIIAIIGLILLMKKTPSGEFVNPYNVKPFALNTERLNWDNLFAFATTLDDAKGWCSQRTVAEGGFREIAQGGQFDCYPVQATIIPQQYRFYYNTLKDMNPRIPPVACFTTEKPEGYNYPLVCGPGLYQ